MTTTTTKNMSMETTTNTTTNITTNTTRKVTTKIIYVGCFAFCVVWVLLSAHLEKLSVLPDAGFLDGGLV